jgi:hypothetical protein
VKNNILIYYAGLCWKKNGQFSNSEERESYLNEFADKLGSPLKVFIHYVILLYVALGRGDSFQT